MGFVMSVSFVIAVVLIANGRALSIGSTEERKEGTESNLEAMSELASIIKDCLNLTVIDGTEHEFQDIEFAVWANMTQAQKCYFGCIFKKAELVSEDNKLSRNGFDKWNGVFSDDYDDKSTSNENKSGPIVFKCSDDEIFSKCSDVTGEDECEATYKIMMCSEKACLGNVSQEGDI